MGAHWQRSGLFSRRLETYRRTDKHKSLIRRSKESGEWLFKEFAVVVICLAVVMTVATLFWVKSEDRQAMRVAQAVQSEKQDVPEDSDGKPVLEYLKSQHASLAGIDLSGAQLGEADLSGAKLPEANLSEAFLFNTNLSGVNLANANLSKANLFGSNLAGAKLDAASLSGAYMIIANLSEANLSKADLSRAYLQGTNFSGADLTETNLSGVYLHGSNLSGAHLSGADLSGANLSSSRNLRQNQLDEACGNDKTRLPEGLTVEACHS